jgi:two-component system alkaline phosphatase synthesis response regulator PhoP
MNKKILVIEDDKDIVELLSHYLEKENFILRDTSDGYSGLKKVKAEDFDLIMLDIMLPEIDGLEVCKELRVDPKTSSIPIIMLTAKPRRRTRSLGLS